MIKKYLMKNSSAVSLFIAASAILSTNASSIADNHLGGLKEWSTDQEIDADSKLDEAAEKAAKKAKKSNVCIPIGEGENCW